MADTYRVEALYPREVWDNDANKGDYPADLSGFDQGPVALFHDQTSDFEPPKVGDEVFGDIEKDKRGKWRLRRKSRPKGGGGGKGGGGYSPADIARMSRAHAQEMALHLIHATEDAKGMNLEDEAVVGAYLNGTFDRLAGWFGRDVDRAEEAVLKAATPSVQQSNGGGGEVPADTRDMQPVAATKADEDIPFRSLPVPDFEARRRDLFPIA